MKHCLSRAMLVGATSWLIVVSTACAGGAEPPATDPNPTSPSAQQPAPAADANGIVYLSPQHDLWIDKKMHAVAMTGKIAVRQGNLEMLACPQGTKEHESIVAVATKAAPVHAALLFLGAKPGHPSKFDDKFHPASGPEVQVLIRWTDTKGEKHEADGRTWIRNVKTGKSLEYPWVFGGSGFQVDPDTHEKYYNADGGDFICVANFPTAMMDLPIESPKAWEEHLFEPFTDRIPPKDTAVELVLIPKLDKSDKPRDKPIEKPADKGAEQK
jgi:hypothetical protein